MIPELITRYVDTGTARLVSRQYPLKSIHPLAEKAAEAAVCAGRQGKYWEMHDKLFATQGDWTAEKVDALGLFKQYAEGLALDATTFGKCLDGAEAALDVQADLMAGQMMGVSATPTFYINDLPLQGGLPIDSMGLVINYVAGGGPSPEIVPQPGDYHMRGNNETAVAITVAFVDYASADSAKHATEVLPQLMSTYVDTGKMLYILHPWATVAGSPSALGAAAAECAGQQGKYWEMHDQLFKDQPAWTAAADPTSLFMSYASTLGLDASKYQTCLTSDWAKQQVDAGTVVGLLYGVPSAPVFLFNNGTGKQGSPTFDEFKTVIDSILNQ